MRRPFLFVLTVVVALLLYARTATFDFVRADDLDLIAGNQAFLSDLSNVPRAFTRSYFEVEADLVQQKTYYRPIAIVSFMTDAARTGGDPAGYHLTNILLHAVVACLVLSLAIAWGAAPLAALAGALVFAVHPVNTQAVAWIAGRNDLLLAAFGLLSLLTWTALAATTEVVALQAASQKSQSSSVRRATTSVVAQQSASQQPQSRWARRATTSAVAQQGASQQPPSRWARRATTLVVAAHLCTFTLAVFSKETGFLFLIIALLYQGLLIRSPLTRTQKFVLVADGAIVIAWAVLRSQALAGMPPELTTDTLTVMASNAPQVLAQLRKILIPIGLNVAPGVQDRDLLLAAITLVALGIAASRYLTGAMIIFAAAWVLLFLVPTLTVAGLPAYEHRAYVPLIGMVLAFAVATRELPVHNSQLPERSSRALGWNFGVRRWLLIVGIAVLAAITYTRQDVFRDPFTYWTDAARDPVFGALANVNLGQLHQGDGRLGEARREYLRALERDPDTPKAHNNLGVVLMKLNEPDLALPHFREETRRHPWNADAWFNLGLFEEMRGNHDAARAHYERAIAENRAFAPAYEKLGLTPPRRN